jgi:hypothetical protein
MKYNEENYGDGSAPKVDTWIVPFIDGPYLTAGKRYAVVAHTAYVLEVVCDAGHRRVFGMEDGTSAHLPTSDPRRCGQYGVTTLCASEG